MSTVNLYDVLNLEQDCTTKDIKKAYRHLVKEYHPDKLGGDDEMFELITHAYNILRDSNSRSEYDQIYKLSKEVDSSHYDLKNQSNKYYEDTNTDITKKSKEEQESEFLKAMDEMDRKHNFRRDEVDSRLPPRDALRRLRDLEQTREHDDIENTHEKIFEDGRFSIEKFNAAFDAMHKGPMEMVPHSGNPDPFNSVSGLDNNFSPVSNYENIYAEEDDIVSNEFGSVNFDNTKKKKLSKNEVEKLAGSNYTSDHNYIDNDYDKLTKKKIEELERDRSMLSDRNLRDFDTDPTCGGYGIFHDIGVNPQNITWENSEDIKERYQKLIQNRKQEF